MTVKSEFGKFTINGKDTFLFGGECHYFRVPKEEWGNRLELLIEAGCNLVSTYVPWMWHEIEEGIYDLTGETREERDLQSFLELIREKGLYCIVRPGPYVMAEVRDEGIPNWLLDKYPEVIAKQRDGQDHPTRVVSYQHPVFLEKVSSWYKAVNHIVTPMQITNDGPVIMYQLCNEIGMLHWVTNTSDYNSDTLQKFEEYLMHKFQTVEEFNRNYGIQEVSFRSFIEIFRQGLGEAYPSFHYEWGKFWRDYIKGYVSELRTMALGNGISVPFIINVHGFKDYSIYSRGVDYPIGLSQLYRTAEFSDVILAGDFYPGHIGYDNYHDLVLSSTYTRAVSQKKQPLFSAEFQSGRLADRPRLYPQDLDLNTRTCVAHGMNALNYYMFVAGENYENIGLFGRRHEWQAPIDSNGNTRPNYEKARHLGHVFKTIGQRLLNASKKVHTFVGFNPDDYMTETVEDRDRKIVNEIISKREHFSFDGIVRLLVGANIQFEAIDLLKELSVKEVPSLWIFATSYMDQPIQSRLVNYVRQGGKLVLYPEIPTKDLQGNDCVVLKDELDLGEWETLSGIGTVDVLGIDSVMVKQRLNFKKFNGDVIASFSGQGGAEVAAFRKVCGQGEVVVLGLGMGQDYGYQLEVIQKIAELIGVSSHLSASNPNFSLVERRNKLDSFIFVINYDEIEQRAVIYENSQSLFDGREIELPPRSGMILTRNFQLNQEITVEYATVEFTGIEATDNRLELKVEPIGASGSLKLTVTGDWQTDAGMREGNTVVIDPIKGPLTISLNK